MNLIRELKIAKKILIFFGYLTVFDQKIQIFEQVSMVNVCNFGLASVIALNLYEYDKYVVA